MDLTYIGPNGTGELFYYHSDISDGINLSQGDGNFVGGPVVFRSNIGDSSPDIDNTHSYEVKVYNLINFPEEKQPDL